MSLYKSITSHIHGFFEREKVAIDNLVFYLHSKVTVILLVTFSTIVAGFEYFGKPIDCFNGSLPAENNEGQFLNVFCWITTTYSMPDLWNASVGYQVIYPGVGLSRPELSRTYHAYYQWVVFILYLQAMAFSLPKFLWNATENNLTATLTEDLKFTVMTPKKRLIKLKRLAEYLERTKHENSFFWFFVFCEILNLINVVGQMFLLDRFLDGKFWSLGKRFFDSTWFLTTDPNIEVAYDPLLEVFPRITKCTFHKFGSSGDLERLDAFCLLTINNVNEKIFVILWFWLHFLSTASFLYFIWRILSIFLLDVRIMSLGLSCAIISRTNVEDIVSRSSISQWFLLKILARNIDERNFDDLCKILLKQIVVREEEPKKKSLTPRQAPRFLSLPCLRNDFHSFDRVHFRQ